MSDTMTAIPPQQWNDGIARIEAMDLQGMITLRGDLGSVDFKNAATGVGGVDMPGIREACSVGARGVCWMSPDEVLLLCPYNDVEPELEKISGVMGDAHYLAVDVSDARAVFEISGEHARDVLAKLAPVDLAPGRFEPPMFRRTRFAQVAAAFWMAEPDTFRIICFRSQAQYLFDLLKVAAQAGSTLDT